MPVFQSTISNRQSKELVFVEVRAGRKDAKAGLHSKEVAVRYLCLLIVMMTTVVLMAADRVGRVTSSGPLTLNGKAVPATAVSSLPVVAGDDNAVGKRPEALLSSNPYPKSRRSFRQIKNSPVYSTAIVNSWNCNPRFSTWRMANWGKGASTAPGTLYGAAEE